MLRPRTHLYTVEFGDGEAFIEVNLLDAQRLATEAASGAADVAEKIRRLEPRQHWYRNDVTITRTA